MLRPWGRRSRRLLITFLFTAVTQPALAEWFVAADATTLETKMKFINAQVEHELEPVRVKFGYMGGIVGWEIQVHEDAKDTIPSVGFNFELENKETLGAFVRVAPEGRSAYFSIGVLRSDSTLTLVENPNVADRELLTLIGVILGYQYRFTDHLGFTLDYSYYEAKHRLPSFVSCPAGVSGDCDRPTVRYSGFGAGLQYTF